MSVFDFVRAWEQLDDGDKSLFADYVGEYLETYSRVTSDAGRLGRMDGVDSRELVEAFEFSCGRIKGNSK